MAMHPRAGYFCQPLVEVFKQIGKTLKDRIRGRRLAVFPGFVREPALHVKTGAALGPPFHRFGKQAVNLAGIGFCNRLARGIFGQERAI